MVTCQKDSKMNGISVCLKEIALEGLDGVTLSTLWERLNSVTPPLLSTLDDSYKAFLWKSFLSSENVQTFLLEKPREELRNFCDDEKVYPFCCINKQESGVRGSCSTFYSRKLVNVNKLESLDVVERKYGSRLVLVASQILRENVLFGQDGHPFVEISDFAYCVLEWIARARRFGRLQSASLPFNNGVECSANYHHIKTLQELQIVTKQIIFEGKVRIYLARFHVEHSRDSLSSRICNIIEAMSNDNNLSMELLFSHFDEPKESVKEVVDKLLETGHVQLLDVHKGHAGSSEDHNDNEECQFGNVIKLVKPFYNLNNDDVDDDEEEMLSVGNQVLLLKLHGETPVANCIYQLVESKGIQGITSVELIRDVGLPYLDIKSLTTLLESQQKVTAIFEDVGRQRIRRYIATKILEQHHNLKEEVCQGEEKVEADKSKNVPSTTAFNDDNDVNYLEASKDNSLCFTKKFQKMRNIVTGFLSRVKVVEGHVEIKKLIIDKEVENGTDEKIDKRTLCRFLDKLKDTGYIQIFDVTIEVEEESHQLHLICEATIQEDSPEVLAVKTRCKKSFQEALKREKAKVVHTISLNHVMGYNTKLGFLPKMPRCEMLHIFLFYLIYELAKPHVNVKAWRQKFEWAEHLTPEHTPKCIGEGWFSASSIAMLLPLSLYVKIIGISFQADIIDQCINNPETKHMLIKDLPAVEGYYLTYRKRHFPNLLDGLQLMAEMNLLIPTTKAPFNFSKDIACHLNETAVLTDTRQCLPHYYKAKHPDGEQFSETVFPLESLSDIEHYWSMVRVICLATPLGGKTGRADSVRRRSRTTLKDFVKDEENMHTSIKPCGDGLGAAGFDSILYCHLIRNWTWKLRKPTSASSKEATGDVPSNSDEELMFNTVTVPAESVLKHIGGKGIKRKHSGPTCTKDENMVKKKLPNDDIQVGEASHQSSLDSNVNPDDVNKKKQASKKTKVGKKSKNRSHWSVKWHDQRDVEAARQNEVLRVCFTPQEQKLLFICILALRILGKKSSDTGYSDWLWIRDILYKNNYESAKTKTALSISRKHRTIMKNPQTKVNLSICTADCAQEKEFQPYCNIGKSCDEKSFNILVELLMKKYSVESTETRPVCLPCSMKTVYKRDNLQSGLQAKNPEKSDKDIKSLKESITCLAHIRHGVIRDAIVSALLLDNEEYDPNAAYVFLGQFVEAELCLAVRELKKKHYITRRPKRCSKVRNLRLAAFCQSISLTGQRVLDAHFPSSVMDEAVSFYNQLQHGYPHSREQLSTGSMQKSTKPQSIALLEESTIGGHVACILSLLAIGKLSVQMEIPENVLRVEFADKNKELEEERQANQAEKKRDTPVVTHAVPQQATGRKKSQGGREPLMVDSGTVNVTEEDTFSAKASSNKRAIHHVNFPLVEQTSGLSVSTSKSPKEPERLAVKNRTGVNLNEKEDGANQNKAKTAGSKRTVHNDKKKIGETSHDSSHSCPKRSAVPASVDVLSGIEDHLFGSYGQSRNARMHKVSLQSKPSYTCNLTTPHGDSIAHAAGDLLSSIQRNVDPHANIRSEHYNNTVLSSRTAGSNIKRPVIKTNPFSIKLSLLSVPESESRPNNSHDVLGCIAGHFEFNVQAVRETLEECKRVCSKEFGFTERDFPALTAVYRSIESSNEIGLSCSDVDEMITQQGFLSEVSTERLIDVLKASNLVSEVGFLEVRFVSCNFKHHWSLPVPPGNVSKESTGTKGDGTTVVTKRGMVACETQTDRPLSTNNVHCKTSVSSVVEPNSSADTCFQNHDVDPLEDKLLVEHDESLDGGHAEANASRLKSASGLQSAANTSNAAEEMEVSAADCVQRTGPISRPWFSMGGQMNKKAYNTFHKSVLCYIMRYPGVKEFTIAKHFVHLIYPVTVRSILQTLQERQCIQKKCIYKKTISLFSSNRVRTQDSLEEDKVTYFLPTADAVTQLINHVLL